MIYTDGTHLVADTLTELHKFARIIGMKREWFQSGRLPHYDIWGSMKLRALRNCPKCGAVTFTVDCPYYSETVTITGFNTTCPVCDMLIIMEFTFLESGDD